jgi:hypothetical protein
MIDGGATIRGAGLVIKRRALMPVTLSADELDIIRAAAAPLAPRERGAFVEAVKTALEGCPELGPGTVYRAARVTQRLFWDPPLVSKGREAGHCAFRSKLRSGSAIA